MSDTDDTEDENVDPTSEDDGETKGNNGDSDVNKKVSSITRNLSNMSIVSPSNSICTLAGCDMGSTKFMLECSKCKKLTHYSCTQLPPYQLSLFMQSGYRRYICSACVGEVHYEILDNCSTPVK